MSGVVEMDPRKSRKRGKEVSKSDIINEQVFKKSEYYVRWLTWQI